MSCVQGRVLVAGRGEGLLLHLEEAVSFWGAVDPLTGKIIDRRHPQFGECIHDRIVLLPYSVGSSSGSAILLETLYRDCGPAGIILGQPDQILTLGAVVAREMEYANIPVVQLDAENFHQLSGRIHIADDGLISY